ncbi:methyl-accepting chemotaxis protein [Thalassotalea sp. M1531]|uniref:Methyl-accepting chemotaxis protein n=1 Tax=Thalassotalea algicola TaxID=2716224 RepID=A0A7Y0Q956_9GAMM|nr:methyl-accepting chemotaxis protein [Thalassotalea algicola]NMP32855.1 methyl-accepting chemotaxis protein [Thalassotalea algicola]
MNVKVAHKIILGFTVILLLLIVSSVSSIGILANIEEATEQVDSQAIPIQQLSNSIQIELLKQAKQASQIDGIQDLALLEQLKIAFEQGGQQLAVHRTKLTKLLKGQPMEKQLKLFLSQYESFVIDVQQMLDNKVGVIEKGAELASIEDELNLYLDEAGALLVDLTYLEDPDEQATIDRIAGAAGQIEGYLINVTDATKSVNQINDLAEVQDSEAVINQSLGTIEQQTVYLVNLGQDYNTDGVIEQFVEEFNKSKNLLSGDNNYFAVKISQLELQKALNISLVSSEKNISQSIEIIDGLLSQVDDNLQRLQQDVFDDVDRGQMLTSIIMIVLIAASITIAFLTIRSMIEPLNKINNVLSSIAQGDLSHQLDVNSRDEYGQLSTNVNSVVSHLKVLIDEIGQNANALNVAANRSEEEIQSVAQSLDTQQDTVNGVTNITQALSLNADEVLAKSTDAESQMTEALDRSNELEQRANSTASKISDLSELLDATAGRMSALDKEATNISSILETIQSIADQTNLLALNAAIEAARAGEAGRGFSVVADEVRMLASRTQESTAEINAMIDSLQSQTGSVVAEIEQGKDGAKLCQTDTERLLETLTTISQAIEQMHMMSSDISSAAEQQNSLSNEINQSIALVSDISQQSSEKSSSTLGYSHEVATLAKQLEQSVDAFKVK